MPLKIDPNIWKGKVKHRWENARKTQTVQTIIMTVLT